MPETGLHGLKPFLAEARLSETMRRSFGTPLYRHTCNSGVTGEYSAVMTRMGTATLLLVLAAAPAARAQSALAGEPIHISRITAPITIDGRLSDPGWEDATRVTTWYETSPGDNTEPPFKNVGYLGFDDSAFYVGFEFEDANPRAIRAPLGDHDHINGSTTDYGGVILDTRNDGHSAVLLLASATGVQYDAVTDDQGSGEDSSPDFFWESAAQITERGWTLEIRIPFSSLRYHGGSDPQTWGILLYRNLPRDFRYQYFSAKLPRGSNCFICRANQLVGLEHLPSGGHIVAAPYVTATDDHNTADGIGTPLHDRLLSHIGGDVKWTPSADHALDFTLRPDFSQVESDTAQISANERFALSFPEKRPFFLEGVELLQTAIKAVYTRTITSPDWGARATGKAHGFSYTVLATGDAGGGTSIVPGSTSSTLVDQPAGSTVIVGRVKRALGRNFVGALVTDRESRDGQGFNRLFGPDFQWRPTNSDSVSGQFLVTATQTPIRPDLIASWDGSSQSGGASWLAWNHNTRHLDSTGGYRDFGNGFRADAGFVPQVGYRAVNGGAGWTVRPRGLLRRERTFLNVERQLDRNGGLIQQTIELGGSMDTRLGGFLQFRYLDDRVSSGGFIFPRRRFAYVVQFNPSRRITQIAVNGTVGEEVDFSNSRLGHGSTVNATLTVVPTDHLEVAALSNVRWVDVHLSGPSQRLFDAQVSRLRGTWSFNAHTFVRVIAQYVATTRDQSLYVSSVNHRDGELTGSALVAYKINWQSVLFVGYGDDRQLDDLHALSPIDHQLFVKMSYAFQR